MILLQDVEEVRQQPQSVAREARDTRERRDVDWLGFRIVLPIPPVSLGYLPRCILIIPDVKTSETPAYPTVFSRSLSGSNIQIC